jgi:hypothetical protein
MLILLTLHDELLADSQIILVIQSGILILDIAVGMYMQKYMLLLSIAVTISTHTFDT